MPTPQTSNSDLDPDMTPDNVTGYLKTKGYSDELAGRLATNVLANPYGSGNYDHIRGTRQWLDKQAGGTDLSMRTQQDRQSGVNGLQMQYLQAARKMRPGSPEQTVALGAGNPGAPAQAAAPQQTMSVMTPQGVKVVAPMIGQWLIKNGQAQPLSAAKGQPGAYMAQALPMATAMSDKWGIDPATASAITDKLLQPVKDEERNPIIQAASAVGDGLSDSYDAIKGVF